MFTLSGDYVRKGSAHYGMIRRDGMVFRAISLFILQAFVITNLCLAGPPANAANSFTDTFSDLNSPAAKDPALLSSDPTKINIPEASGSVKDKYAGKSGMVIVHIQDAHCNYEAQSNIVKILESLINNYDLQFIALEGADGDIDTTWFKAFPDEEIRKEVADYFMKKGEITGAEYLSITSDYSMKLYGAETREYYINNLNAFTKTYGIKSQIDEYINQVRGILNNLKRYIYSAKLKAFDAKVSDYNDKRLTFTDYAVFLSAHVEKQKVNANQFVNFNLLVSTIEEEKKIDFAKVNKERTQLIDLFDTKLSKDDLSELVVKSLAYKVAKMSSAEYYNYLKELAGKSGVNLAEYPNLSLYIKYVNLHFKINAEKLFDEIEDLEIAIRKTIYTNDEEMNIDKFCKYADILYKLGNIKLSNKEFQYYKSHREDFQMDPFADFIAAENKKYGLNNQMPASYKVVLDNMENLENFYLIAIKRDQALVDNTLGGMDKNKAKLGVLITGGFHTQGITQLLKQKDISYLVVSPVITKEAESPYIEVLTNQRTPFEDLIVMPRGKKNEMLAPPVLSDIDMMADADIEGFAGRTPEERNLEARVDYARACIERAMIKAAQEDAATPLGEFKYEYIKQLGSHIDQLGRQDLRDAVMEAANAAFDRIAGSGVTTVAMVQQQTGEPEGMMRETGDISGTFRRYGEFIPEKINKLLLGNLARFASMGASERKKAINRINRYSEHLVLGELDRLTPDVGLTKELRVVETDLMEGCYINQLLFAGSATRAAAVLGGSAKYLFDPAVFASTEFTIDSVGGDQRLLEQLIEFQAEMREGGAFSGIKGGSLGAREIIAYRLFLENIARKNGQDPKAVVKNAKLLVHVNDLSVEEVVGDIVDHNYFGFSRENILFCVVDTFPLQKIQLDGTLTPSTTRRGPGHGFTMVQIVMPGTAFHIDENGQRVYTEQSPLEYFKDRGAKYMFNSNIEDLTKLEIGDMSEAGSFGTLFLRSLAYGRRLFDQGNKMVVQTVENVTGQKGGTWTKGLRTGNRALVETPNLEGLILVRAKREIPAEAFGYGYTENIQAGTYLLINPTDFNAALHEELRPTIQTDAGEEANPEYLAFWRSQPNLNKMSNQYDIDALLQDIPRIGLPAVLFEKKDEDGGLALAIETITGDLTQYIKSAAFTAVGEPIIAFKAPTDVRKTLRTMKIQEGTEDFVALRDSIRGDIEGSMREPALPEDKGKTVGSPLSDDVIDAIIADDTTGKFVIFGEGKPADLRAINGEYDTLVELLRISLSQTDDRIFSQILNSEYVKAQAGTELGDRLAAAFTKSNLLQMLQEGSGLRIMLLKPKEEIGGVPVPGIRLTRTGSNYGHYSTTNNSLYLPQVLVDELLRNKSDAAARYKILALLAHELVEYVILKNAFPDIDKIVDVQTVEGQAHFVAQLFEVALVGASARSRPTALGPVSTLDDLLEDVTDAYFEAKAGHYPRAAARTADDLAKEIAVLVSPTQVLLELTEADQEEQKQVVIVRTVIPENQKKSREARGIGLNTTYALIESSVSDVLDKRTFADGKKRYQPIFVRDAAEANAMIVAGKIDVSRAIVIVPSDEADKLPDEIRVLSVVKSQNEPGKQFVDLPGLVRIALPMVNLTEEDAQDARITASLAALYQSVTGVKITPEEMAKRLVESLFSQEPGAKKRFLVELPDAERFELKEIEDLQRRSLQVLLSA